MKSLINKMKEKASTFSVLDYGIFKVYLIAFGIIIGTYFSGFFSNFYPVLWAIFIICGIYMIYRLFINKANKN